MIDDSVSKLKIGFVFQEFITKMVYDISILMGVEPLCEIFIDKITL